MFSGIRTDRMKFLIYTLAGAITGFAAFINVIKVGSVTSSGGNQLETQILIALVLILVFLILFYVIYMNCTPEACLPPDQWQKIWRLL